MTLEVDYVPFATGGGANVYAPATYQANPVVGTGVEPGLADGQLSNTTWRLASMPGAALANFISQQLGINVLDDGNLTALTANLTAAIAAPSSVKPTRIVSSSATLNLSCTSDYRVALNRTSGPTAQVVNLAATGTLVVGQEFVIADVAGNFDTAAVTVTPPGGHTIAGLSTYVMNEKRQSAKFAYAGSSIWTIEASS